MSRMWTVASGPRHRTGTNRCRKGDVRHEAFGQGRPDPPDALQLSHRAESAARRPVLDDAACQRRPDAGQAFQLVCVRDVDVHGCERLRPPRRPPSGRQRAVRGRRGSRGLGVPWRTRPPARRHGGIHGRDLRRQRRAIRGGGWHRPQRAAATHAQPERGYRREKQQGASFAGRGHTPRCVRRPREPSPGRRGRHRNSRNTVIATSPTTCSVRWETLSSVSSGV